MKISDQQIFILFKIAEDSLVFADTKASPFSFGQQQRLKVVNDILNQQDRKIKDYDPLT